MPEASSPRLSALQNTLALHDEEIERQKKKKKATKDRKSNPFRIRSADRAMDREGSDADRDLRNLNRNRKRVQANIDKEKSRLGLVMAPAG